MLRFGTEIHQPVVEPQTEIEAVGMSIQEVHLPDQAGHVARIAERMGEGAAPPIERHPVVDNSVRVRMYPGEE
jgi:hypothetical protein